MEFRDAARTRSLLLSLSPGAEVEPATFNLSSHPFSIISPKVTLHGRSIFTPVKLHPPRPPYSGQNRHRTPGVIQSMLRLQLPKT